MATTQLVEWLDIPRAPEEIYAGLRKKVTRVRRLVVAAAVIFGTLIGTVLVYVWPHGAPFPSFLNIPVFLAGFAVTGLGVWVVERFRVLPWMDAWNKGTEVEHVRMEGGRLRFVARNWSWNVRGISVARVPVDFPGWVGLRVKHPKEIGKFALLLAPLAIADRIVSVASASSPDRPS
jgi:hypothetical protein